MHFIAFSPVFHIFARFRMKNILIGDSLTVKSVDFPTCTSVIKGRVKKKRANEKVLSVLNIGRHAFHPSFSATGSTRQMH